MNTLDYFESSTISMVLSWSFSIIFILSILYNLVAYFINDYEDEYPTLFTIWIFVCLLLLSPIRLLLFHVLLAISFINQSFNALFDSMLLALYVPIIWIILFLIGCIIPFLIINFCAKYKIWIAAIVAPIACMLGSYLFLLALPIAGKTTHWLDVKDVIKATNGPPYLYYRYIGHWGFYEQKQPKTNDFHSDYKTIYRGHVASIYLSKENQYYFIQKTFPEGAESMDKQQELINMRPSQKEIEAILTKKIQENCNALINNDYSTVIENIYPEAFKYLQEQSSEEHYTIDQIKDTMKESFEEAVKMGYMKPLKIDFDKPIKRYESSNTLIYSFSSTLSSLIGDQTKEYKSTTIAISSDYGQTWFFLTHSEESGNVLRRVFSQEQVRNILKDIK